MPYLLTTYYFNVLSSQSYLRKKKGGGGGIDPNACNSVRDILFYTDVVTSVVEFIVYSPVGKLI